MRLELSTPLPIPADRAWAAVLRFDTFRQVTRGLLGIRIIEGPDHDAEWKVGMRCVLRLYALHLLPGWRHELTIVGLDPVTRTLRTHECGGPLRVWNHTLRVEPLSADRCRYTDELEIDAGLLTPLAWLIAAGFFRYRQLRWRRLASQL